MKKKYTKPVLTSSKGHGLIPILGPVLVAAAKGFAAGAAIGVGTAMAKANPDKTLKRLLPTLSEHSYA